MIKISGTIKRAFMFPASAEVALRFYSDLPRVTQYMPHINLVETFSPNQVRVLYKSVELVSYTIRIFCDLEGAMDLEHSQLYILPLEGYQPVESKASLNSSTAQGIFALKASVFELDEYSRIEYQINLRATMPRPSGMRLMPGRVVNRIANNITKSRIKDIADGFIKTSVASFPQWQIDNMPA